MGILSYRIKNDELDLTEVHPQHPMHKSYRQPNSAWAALKKHYGLDKDTLKSHGWKVKLDVDESALAVAAAEVAIEQAPIPNAGRRIFGAIFAGIFGKKG